MKKLIYPAGYQEVGAGGGSSDGIVEIVDTVNEGNPDGCDTHNLKETQSDGTKNDVGKFVVAQAQITGIAIDTNNGITVQLNAYDQNGNPAEFDAAIFSKASYNVSPSTTPSGNGIYKIVFEGIGFTDTAIYVSHDAENNITGGFGVMSGVIGNRISYIVIPSQKLGGDFEYLVSPRGKGSITSVSISEV